MSLSDPYLQLIYFCLGILAAVGIVVVFLVIFHWREARARKRASTVRIRGSGSIRMSP